MLGFLRKTQAFVLFVLLQGIFMYIDVLYVISGEGVKVHLSMLAGFLGGAFLLLAIRTIVEAGIILAVSELFRQSVNLKSVVDCLLESMKLPNILVVIYTFVQLVFIRSMNEIYQTIALGSVSLLYIIMCIVAFWRLKNKPVVACLAVYAAAYTVIQVKGVIAIL